MQDHVKAPQGTSKGEVDLTVEDPAEVVDQAAVDQAVVEPSVVGQTAEEHTLGARDRDASDDCSDVCSRLIKLIMITNHYIRSTSV